MKPWVSPPGEPRLGRVPGRRPIRPLGERNRGRQGRPGVVRFVVRTGRPSRSGPSWGASLPRATGVARRAPQIALRHAGRAATSPPRLSRRLWPGVFPLPDRCADEPKLASWVATGGSRAFVRRPPVPGRCGHQPSGADFRRMSEECLQLVKSLQMGVFSYLTQRGVSRPASHRGHVAPTRATGSRPRASEGLGGTRSHLVLVMSPA